MPKVTRKRWAAEDVRYLKTNHKKKTFVQIAQHLIRDELLVRQKASRLGLTKQDRWTAEEIKYLKKNYTPGNIAAIEKKLNKTKSAISGKAYSLSLTGSRENWTAEMISLLKKLYPKTENTIVAEKIGVTVDAVRSKAVLLKIKKSDRYWDKPWEDLILKNWDVMSPEELITELKNKFKVEKTKWAIINKYRELTGKRKFAKKQKKRPR